MSRRLYNEAGLAALLGIPPGTRATPAVIDEKADKSTMAAIYGAVVAVVRTAAPAEELVSEEKAGDVSGDAKVAALEAVVKPLEGKDFEKKLAKALCDDDAIACLTDKTDKAVLKAISKAVKTWIKEAKKDVAKCLAEKTRAAPWLDHFGSTETVSYTHLRAHET